MKRAYISLFPAIAVAAMTLAACGNSNNSNNGSGESEPTTGVEPVESDSSAASGISEGGSGTGLFTDILDGIKEATSAYLKTVLAVCLSKYSICL